MQDLWFPSQYVTLGIKKYKFSKYVAFGAEIMRPEVVALIKTPALSSSGQGNPGSTVVSQPCFETQNLKRGQIRFTTSALYTWTVSNALGVLWFFTKNKRTLIWKAHLPFHL
jgi:hypothetical protein